jgi:hypothetical protein
MIHGKVGSRLPIYYIVALTTVVALPTSVAFAQSDQPTTPPPIPSAVPAPPAPSAGGPPPVVAAPAPPPPAPGPDNPELKKIQIGFALRSGARFQSATGSGLGDFGFDEIYAEERFSGQLTPIFAWQVNLNEGVPINNGLPDFSFTPSPAGQNPGGPDAGVAIMDLILKVEPDPAFHFWTGRMLIPSDRANFSGPWFISPWKYPGLAFARGTVTPIGPKTGPFGRGNGLQVWGELLDSKVKYFAGVFSLNDVASHPLYSGRLNFDIIGKEPGFYHASTYYGHQDIVAVAIAGQYQKNAAFDNPTDAYTEFSIDGLGEKTLPGVGTLTLEAAYYHFPHFATVSRVGAAPVAKNFFYVLGSYLTPMTIGIGKLQPLIRYQQASDAMFTLKIIDAYVTYVMDDYFLRAAIGYEHTDFGTNNTTNAILFGLQMQR